MDSDHVAKAPYHNLNNDHVTWVPYHSVGNDLVAKAPYDSVDSDNVPVIIMIYRSRDNHNVAMVKICKVLLYMDDDNVAMVDWLGCI